MSEGNGSTPGGRAVIRISGLTKSFGDQTVVNIDELVLGSKPVEGLIGPNGAGKTTLMRLIMRSTRADTGSVVLDDGSTDVALSKLPPHRIASLGVVKTNQVTQDFAGLTIWDSLLLAVAQRHDERPHRIYRERHLLERHGEEIRSYLDLFEFSEPAGFAHSTGEKKLLDVIRCLLLNPKILLLDEPTAGLPDDVTTQIIDLLRIKVAEGMSVIIVEHDLDVIWGFSDIVHFMAEGDVILEGDPAYIRAHSTVVEKYLGSGHV
ncbi:MAG: ATP-binding cassette domain-containing protein [bacterium]|nr:ATP-binding cassette domain-containing protein [bacterium]